MNHGDKLHHLRELKSEKVVREFLMDLLHRLGFKEVYHTHRYGAPEFGKDIIAKRISEFEGDEWYAFVVKHGKILGGTNEIETIKNQIKQAFEYPYENIDGTNVTINKVKVVTNDSISTGAIKAIRDSDNLRTNANYDFWWNERLIEFVDKYYSDFWLPGDFISKEYSRALHNSIKAEFELKELSIKKLPDKKIEKLLDLFINPQLMEFKSTQNSLLDKTVKTHKVQIDDIVNSDNCFIIEGDPGSGKSRLLNRLTCLLLEPATIERTKYYPVKIKISTLRENSFKIRESVTAEISKLIPDSNQRIDLSLHQIIVLIDSVDDLYSIELKELIDNIKKEIIETKNRFIVSARNLDQVNFKGAKRKIRELHLQNFNSNQITGFVHKYFEGSSKGEKLIQVLRESNILDKLPTTPLTITLISLLYEDTDYEIPATLTDIYSDFTSILLGKLEVRSRTQLIDLELKKRVFSHIAYHMLETKTFEVNKADFIKKMHDFLVPKGVHPKSDEDLFRVVENSGLIFIGSDNNVGFKHMSFLEYFAAYESFYVRGDHIPLVSNFNDVNWQNTTVFYAGISKEMPRLIEDLLKHVPNNSIQDWFINIGGFGYLGQALYMTDTKDRNKLVHAALDNLLLSFENLKKQTNEFGAYYQMPLHILGAMIAYWFSMNFKSITLIDCLQTSYDEIIESQQDNLSVENFKTGLKLFLLASTLASKYLNCPDKINDLLNRDCFIKDPLLVILFDISIDMQEMDEKLIGEHTRKKIRKEIERYKKLIIEITKKPAYRFLENYAKAPLSKDE